MQKRFLPSFDNIDLSLCDSLAAETGLDKYVARILTGRHLADLRTIHTYISPCIHDLEDPHLLPSIDSACELIQSCIASGRKICIYGDYDVDGICATAILYKQIKRMGGTVFPFIPSRLKDGYGMNLSTVSEICDRGTSLIVTVDNGINSVQEVEYCKGRGVDVIITDHHIPGEHVPDAAAVVAACLPGSAYPNPFLCGAGVAFKVATVLNRDTVDEEFLALAAVATISDIVPMNAENHAIAKLGLRCIHKNKGLSYMIRQSGFESTDEKTVSFYISPRLNAAGRMSTPDQAFKLIISEDSVQIQSLFDDLNRLNSERKAEEEKIISDLKAEGDIYDRNAVVAYSPKWHLGVLGIASNRVSSAIHKPAILFTNFNDELIVGSGRSSGEIDLFDSLIKFSGMFERFGGHSKASGITMKKENFDSFRILYDEYIGCKYHAEMQTYTVKYDLKIPVSDVSLNLAQQILSLRPFGPEFEEPRFLISGCEAMNFRQIGKNDRFFSAEILQGDQNIRLVSFSPNNSPEMFEAYGSLDLICRIRLNTFYQRGNVELLLEDFKAHRNDRDTRDSFSLMQLHDAILDEFMYNDLCIYSDIYDIFKRCDLRATDRSLFTQERMRKNYMLLKSLTVTRNTIDFLKLSPELLVDLCVFWELGFFERVQKEHCFRISPEITNRILNDSVIYSIITETD